MSDSGYAEMELTGGPPRRHRERKEGGCTSLSPGHRQKFQSPHKASEQKGIQHLRP